MSSTAVSSAFPPNCTSIRTPAPHISKPVRAFFVDGPRSVQRVPNTFQTGLSLRNASSTGTLSEAPRRLADLCPRPAGGMGFVCSHRRRASGPKLSRTIKPWTVACRTKCCSRLCAVASVDGHRANQIALSTGSVLGGGNGASGIYDLDRNPILRSVRVERRLHVVAFPLRRVLPDEVRLTSLSV